MPTRKLPPIPPDWEADAECDGKNYELWDVGDVLGEGGSSTPHKTVWRQGRQICIRDCIVREYCLRVGLRQEALGVVRGGYPFDLEQQRKKKAICVLCGFRVAALMYNRDGQIILNPDGVPTGVCWICRRYAPCLNNCGRMVPRKAGVSSYYCIYCSK